MQHFWSLAVEEQFYLVWPLLLLILTVWARPKGRDKRNGLLSGRSKIGGRSLLPSLLVGMIVVAIPSLLWSVQLTAANPSVAYFVTTTRLWELALGGGIAMLARHLAMLPRALAILLGWAGAATVVVSAFVITAATPFPGSAALAPTLGTAAVIATGAAAGRFGPRLLLGVGPMLWVGKLSYSLYLWHWPLLAIAAAQLGDLTVTEGLVITMAAFLPAYLAFRYIEDPLRSNERFSRLPEDALWLGAVCTSLGVLAGLALSFAVWPPPPPLSDFRLATSGQNASSQPEIGAMVLGPTPRDDPAGAPVDSVEYFTPDPSRAEQDTGAICGVDETQTEVVSCVSRRPAGRRGCRTYR